LLLLLLLLAFLLTLLALLLLLLLALFLFLLLLFLLLLLLLLLLEEEQLLGRLRQDDRRRHGRRDGGVQVTEGIERQGGRSRHERQRDAGDEGEAFGFHSKTFLVLKMGNCLKMGSRLQTRRQCDGSPLVAAGTFPSKGRSLPDRIPKERNHQEGIAMAATQRREPPVPKMFEDRVRPDAETVEHALEPDRTPDKVFYRDPEAPRTEGQTAPDSMADVEMARRTDAGPLEAETSKYRESSPALWVALGVLVLLVVASVAFF
jgi:hypothetical protein